MGQDEVLIGGKPYGSFGEWLSYQRKAIREWHQSDLEEKLRTRMQAQGIEKPKVSRSLLSLLEGDRLRASADVFNAIISEFGITNQNDVAALRELAKRPPVGIAAEPIGESTRHLRELQMSIDPSMDYLYEHIKRIKTLLDQIPEEAIYIRPKDGVSLERTGVRHATVRISTFLLFLDRLRGAVWGFEGDKSAVKGSMRSEQERQLSTSQAKIDSGAVVVGLKDIKNWLGRLGEKLNDLGSNASSKETGLTQRLEVLKTEVEEYRRHIEALIMSVDLYEIGKKFGKRAGPDLVDHNLSSTKKYIDTAKNLIVLIQTWDARGGWGDLQPEPEGLREQEWRLVFRNSLFELEEQPQRRQELATVWAGYLHGYIEEALEVNAKFIQSQKLSITELSAVQLPTIPKPETGKDYDFWVHNVEVEVVNEVDKLKVESSDGAEMELPRDPDDKLIIFKVIFQRSLIMSNHTDVDVS